MNSHPFLTFLFALANLISGCGFALVTLTILPRARLSSRFVRVSTITCFLATSVAHFALAATVVFDENKSFAQLAGTPTAMIIQSLIALGIWVFLFGVYIQVGRLDVQSRRQQPVHQHRDAPAAGTGD